MVATVNRTTSSLSALTALVLLALGGCPGQGGTQNGPPLATRTLTGVQLDDRITGTSRSFLTGAVPAAFTFNTGDEGVQFRDRVVSSAALSDVFVARPRMDWVNFGENGNGRLKDDLIASVRLARESGAQHVLIEIDPVADRRSVGILPPELAGRDFSDPLVSEPVTRMAVEAAVQLRPTYLSISVEINGYYEADPEGFQDFVQLHKATYDAVKAAAPEVQFFVAFNLEALQGYFRGRDEFSTHGPQWFLIDMFEPKLDAVAFSTLPFGFFIRPLLLPDDYLSRIAEHTTRDILFTEIGWPGDADGALYTLDSQVEYLARMWQLLETIPQVRLVAWTTMYDADPDSVVLVSEDFKNLGLLDFFDEPKPSLGVWQQIHQLPFQPR